MSLLVVEIIKLTKHPEASKLHICQVSDGQKTTQVVCGAHNVRQGMKTILAEVGSVTPTGLTIKEAKLRGVESRGMLCSAKDLGVSKEAGIVDLPSITQMGQLVSELDSEHLSSIPWYNYKQVEALYEDLANKRIHVIRHGNTPNPDFLLLSKTYFHEGEYLHRHFKN